MFGGEGLTAYLEACGVPVRPAVHTPASTEKQIVEGGCAWCGVVLSHCSFWCSDSCHTYWLRRKKYNNEE